MKACGQGLVAPLSGRYPSSVQHFWFNNNMVLTHQTMPIVEQHTMTQPFSLPKLKEILGKGKS